TIPGSFPIPSPGIYPGRIIKVKGQVPNCSPRFAINLQCGPKMHPGEDIAFHFNPRFVQNTLVRNHFACSGWGTEEVSNGVPMKAGECFEVLIHCYYYNFKVEVNGIFACEFNHRIDFDQISHIMVDGDVTIHQISFEGLNPPQDPKLMIPCVVPVPGDMRPGRTVRVKGVTPCGVKRFAVNLQCGPNLHPDEDIAFHFNPRFCQKAVVRNHFIWSGWGPEETQGPLPLSSGEPFEVFIHCYKHAFKAFLNGSEICDFNHRIPIERISHVMIDGDALIYEIDFDVPLNPNIVKTITGQEINTNRVKRFVTGYFVPQNKTNTPRWGNGTYGYNRNTTQQYVNPVQNYNFSKPGCEPYYPNPPGYILNTLLIILPINPAHPGYPQYPTNYSGYPVQNSQQSNIKPLFPTPPGYAQYPSSAMLKNYSWGYVSWAHNNSEGKNSFRCKKYNDDVAFNFKPRFEEGYIVRNHYISGSWGREETQGGLPLRRGETFEANFICHYDRFKVLLNGHHFCDFKHRVPFHRISHIAISYDVTIQLIDFEGMTPPLEYIVSSAMLKNDSWGYVSWAHNNSEGKNSFRCKKYNDDVAFNFNPRFEEGYIVRNHYISGSWGREETQGGLPLRRGETFEANFICHYDRFKVLLNGQHFCDFKHRVPFHRISHITISYDVTIQLIDFEGIPPPLEYIVSSAMLKNDSWGYVSWAHNNSEGKNSFRCKKYNDDVAFNFKPRFEEGYIVRNHYISGSWGREETQGGLPLRRGETFEANFICHYDRFKVLLNGQHFCDFKHRVPFHWISHITISYDVTIQLIDFEGIPPPLEYIPGKPHSSEEVCGKFIPQSLLNKEDDAGNLIYSSIYCLATVIHPANTVDKIGYIVFKKAFLQNYSYNARNLRLRRCGTLVGNPLHHDVTFHVEMGNLAVRDAKGEVTEMFPIQRHLVETFLDSTKVNSVTNHSNINDRNEISGKKGWGGFVVVRFKVESRTSRVVYGDWQLNKPASNASPLTSGIPPLVSSAPHDPSMQELRTM
ncbi:hypothetical protein HW555_009379, partial [Spodoptera exigua]